MQWNEPTDNITWEASEEGLVCVNAPEDSPIKKNDILLTVRKYVIKNKVDLQRTIAQKRYCLYEIERGGILKIVGVDISTRYTPLSYYILVFSGVLMILLCLRIININLKGKKKFSPPANFYYLALTFSGFLIFSPTGAYNNSDFVYLVLDTVSFLFFPALLLHYSLYYPVKSLILRKINPKFLKSCIYVVPSAILGLNLFFLISSMSRLDADNLLRSINHFRDISLRYFSLYLYISLIFFLISNLTLIFKRKEKRYILPLIGISISIASLLLFNFVLNVPAIYLNLSLLLLGSMPFTLTFYLGHRKFTDIEDVIKKTIAVTFIFPFIFGIYFFLGSTIEQNKLLGIFWPIIAIITAGLLYKPIENTAHLYFEKLFFRGTFNFKRKLKELIESLPTERDLHSLSTSFINTINRGFQLERSTFILHQRKNVFYALPRKDEIPLSRSFRHDLFRSTHLAFYSAAEFKRRYPKDYEVLKGLHYSQFLPLKTRDRLIGLVAIGIKEDGTYLSVEDWELLLSLSSSLSLSVENASLYSELKNQFEEIRLLKEFNENIIKNINLGIVVLTGLNIIKTWNNIMELKFKIPAHEAISKKAHAIFGIDVWKRIYRQKDEISTLSNVTIEIQEEEFIFDIYISPLTDSMGRRIGTILAFEDMTEKIFIQDQLVTSEKMASLGLLSAGIAHEVNTPLTGISSYCQIILDNPKDPENTELISRIQEQVQRANKIIRSLLDFSRQKGEQPMEVDLNLVINASIALVEHKLKQRNIRLNRDYQFKYQLYGFFSRLQQMFINLLLNAIDAITNNNDGLISISGQETNTEVSVRITDNGKGIESKYLDKIFDPFFTTKEEGKGTGLGLSIVYTIVEEHYGEIKAASKLDRGTVFTITFPISNPLRSIKP